MRNTNLSNDITRYIKGRASELVTIEEVTSELGIEPAQVRYAMRRLIEKTALGKYITVFNRGNAWQIGSIPGSRKPKTAVEIPTTMDWSEPVAAPAPLQSYEQVGVTGDGSKIVRDTTGKLYKLTAL